MKIIITENKLYSIFEKYMDSYGLSYDDNSKEFIDKNGNEFGWMAQVIFRPRKMKIESLNSIFSMDVRTMLKIYLTDRFPQVRIVYMD